MHLRWLLVLSFVSFIFSSSVEKQYDFSILRIEEELPTPSSVNKLLAVKKELVSSLNIMKNEGEVTLLFKAYRTLNEYFKTKEVTDDLFKQLKTDRVLSRNKFKQLISFLPELILKYQKLLYLYNSKNRPNLIEEIQEFHDLVSAKLQSLKKKILHKSRVFASESCFKIDKKSLSSEDFRPHLARRVKNLVLMMVIESIKPMILNQLTGFESRVLLGSHRFTPLFAPVIDDNFFFVLQDINIADIYFMKETIPHPDVEGSIQRLVFPMDIIENDEAFLHSKNFFRTFYLNARMRKLVNILPDSMQSEKNLNYNKKMWEYFEVCVNLLYAEFKKNRNSKPLIKISEFHSCEGEMKTAIGTLQKQKLLRDELRWSSQLGKFGLLQYFQQIYEKNYPYMFILNALFLLREKQFLKPSVLPPSSSSQASRQEKNLYDKQCALHLHSSNRIIGASEKEQSKSNRSPRGSNAAGTSHDKVPSTSKVFSHSSSLTQSFQQSSPQLTIVVEKPKKRKHEDEMDTIDNSQVLKKMAFTSSASFTVNQEPSSSYYETPIINPTDLVNTHFQQSVTNEDKFHESVYLSDLDNPFKNSEYDAATPSVFNAKKSVQNEEALLNENAVDHSDIFEAARNHGPSSSHGGLEFWSPF